MKDKDMRFRGKVFNHMSKGHWMSTMRLMGLGLPICGRIICKINNTFKSRRLCIRIGRSNGLIGRMR